VCQSPDKFIPTAYRSSIYIVIAKDKNPSTDERRPHHQKGLLQSPGAVTAQQLNFEQISHFSPSQKMSKQPFPDDPPPPAYSEINTVSGPSTTQLGFEQPFSSPPYPTQAGPVIPQPPMGSTVITVAPTHRDHQQTRNIMIINARSKKILRKIFRTKIFGVKGGHRVVRIMRLIDNKKRGVTKCFNRQL
jgi:hypothetical protein